MNLEALYQEIEAFKAGGTLSSTELTDLYKKRETYKSRKLARNISGIIYLLIVIFLLLSFFYAPVRSFVLSFLNLNGDFDNFLSGSFWKLRGALFLASLIASHFLFFWRTASAVDTIAGSLGSSLFLLGMIITPYLALLGLLLIFFFSFSISDFESDIKKAESKRMKEIYNIALEKNDMTLMQSLAEIPYKEAESYLLKKKEEENERKQKEAEQQEEIKKQQEKLIEDQLKGQKMYEEAIASDPVNEELMKQAAKLGSVSACYYLGKNLLSDWLSDMYTAEEKEQIAEDAAKYFDVARQMAALAKLDIKTECEFLWLFSRLQYERNTKTAWKQMLQDFRSIQKSGKLSEEYTDTLNSAIKTVINTIDTLDKQENSQQPAPTDEHTKTLHCKFRNGAICTKNSNSVMIYHCNYVNNPASCITARDEKALEWR